MQSLKYHFVANLKTLRLILMILSMRSAQCTISWLTCNTSAVNKVKP